MSQNKGCPTNKGAGRGSNITDLDEGQFTVNMDSPDPGKLISLYSDTFLNLGFYENVFARGPLDRKHICSTDVSLTSSVPTHPTGQKWLW